MMGRSLPYCLHCMLQNCAEPKHAEPPGSPHGHLPPGSLLNDRFYIGRYLGSGGFGIVYIARDLVLDRRVAIKEYFPANYAERDIRNLHVQVVQAGPKGESFAYGLSSFLEEARTLARLRDDSIVEVNDFFRANGTAYFVMPFLEGESLESKLERSAGNRIAESEVLAVIRGVLKGLRHIHGNELVHRDIKPNNIYLIGGRCENALLLDFGAARAAFGRHTRHITVMLTPGYAPPEQYRAAGRVGPWTDIYACSAVLYRCLTGKLPPEATGRAGDDLPDLVSKSAVISTPLGKAIQGGLSLDPARRPQSVNAYSRSLESATGSPPVMALVRKAADYLRAWNTPVGPDLPGERKGYITGIRGPYSDARAAISAPVRLGRSPDCTFVLNGRQISGFHAEIRFVEEGCYFLLRDLRSTNGTFAQNESGCFVRLPPGTELRMHPGREFYLVGPECARFKLELLEPV